MKKIDNITEDASQLLHLNSEDGGAIDITLKFLSAIQRWSIDIESPSINVSNIILANHPNLLWSFSDVGSFGLACLSKDDVDPFQFDDFSSNRNELFILSEEEIISARNYIAAYPGL